tara:strand:+ start:2701 stop:3363 length:663 start_codon:yes stop_codon:yes gene_type:complete
VYKIIDKKMKKVLFIVFLLLITISFGQDERDKKLVSDLKIGTYDNQNKLTDTLGVYVSSPNRTGLYDLYIDITLSQRKKTYSGLGIAIDKNSIDRFFSSLRFAQKEYQYCLNDKNCIGNKRISSQTVVKIYQWDYEDKDGPANRTSENNNQKVYPLSMEIININGQPELWIYTHGESSNPKEIAIVLNSSQEINSFLNLIDPNKLRQKIHQKFKPRGKKN